MARLPVVTREPAQLIHQRPNQETSVPTIDGTSPTNPAEAPGASPQRVPRITLVIHNLPDKPVHPTVPTVTPAPTNRGQAGARPATTWHRSGKHRLEEPPWLGLADRVLTSWPITLRLALLMGVLLTGTAALAAIVGVGGQLLLAALGLQARRERQRRMSTQPKRTRAEENSG